MSLNENEDRYRFCCGSFHAERGAYVIAIGGIVLTSLSLLGGLVELSILDILLSLACIAVYVAIIFAQKRNEPRLYLPFLVIIGLYIASAVLISVLLIFMAAFHPHAIEHIIGVHDYPNWLLQLTVSTNDPDAKIAEVRIAAISIVVALSSMAAFHAFLWRIVFLAYEYMNLGLSALGADPTYPHYNEV